ncbi:hypothetical protein [Pseudobutyrivibrio sp.]|jgi:hypothetical protein|uniref:hypothetical protein n=1 Tax=Pseudobutyrivibrio sp. TaxID=2014367 RepID=UPI0025D9BF9D|nr:hypothetical protein [Pseudobutyrivibrio sp.]
MRSKRLCDIKNRDEAIKALKEIDIEVTPDMSNEEVDDLIRSMFGLDFNIENSPEFDYSNIVIPEDTEFSETHKGPTLNGGAYGTAYFYDENHMPCKKEDAKYMNIVEYSADGERINESYGV